MRPSVRGRLGEAAWHEEPPRPPAPERSARTSEDAPLTFDVLAGASDLEPDIQTVSLGAGPRHGSAMVDPNSYEITCTANPDYHVPDSLRYILSDEDGLTDTGEVALEVRAVNNPLQFSNGPLKRQVARSAQAGDELGAPATATDADGDPENGHHAMLGAETTITVEVTSADGSRTKSYLIEVSKPPWLSGLSSSISPSVLAS